MRQFRGFTVLYRVTTWMLALSVEVVMAQTPSLFSIVTPAEQATRDSERMQILREELAREQSTVAEAIKRRADRLAARDQKGVEEAEELQIRAAENIASLRREIDTATKQPGQPKIKTEVASAPASRRASNAAHSSDVAVPWWDVYGKAPRRDERTTGPQPVSESPPLAATVTTQRMH